MKFSIFLLSIFACCLSDTRAKVINIESGPISGDNFQNYIAYRGIPYAEPPVGDLRFASPKPYKGKWSEVKEFKKFGAVCAQYSHLTYAFEGEEDCLFLNIFVPKSVAESNEKVPVIFYIHGGAFMFGAGQFYGPENIMAHQNMILVTINYRVGVLGFLSTEDKAIPGNFGLKDQVEALKWVQRNIEAFNGDPKKVTITGFSAGGASVHLHYMSPLSKGLFNNGISHSGSALDPWVTTENAREKAEKIGSLLKCSEKDHNELLICLREKPAHFLVMFAKLFQPFLFNPYSPFAVVAEPQSGTAFITDHPKNLLEKGKFQKLPWMISQTQDEGLYPAAEFYSDEKHLKKIDEKWSELAPFLLDFNGTTTNESRKSQMAHKIRKFYMGYSKITKESFEALDNIFSDRLFKHGAFKSIQLQSKFSPSVYFYYFRFKTLDGLGEIMAHTKDNIGVSHGEDVWEIYTNSGRDYIKKPYSKEEVIVSDNLIKMYYDFASTNSAKYGASNFEACKSDDIKYMEISGPHDYKIIKTDEHFGNVLFWDDIEKILHTPDRTFYDEL